MNSLSRRLARVGVIAFAIALTAACSGSPEAEVVEATVTVPPSASHSVSSTQSPTTASSSSVAPPVTSAAAPPTSHAAPIVADGAECGPRGSVAMFADGTTAYCARLQYTDGAAWSRDPNLAPNPGVAPVQQQVGPQTGDQCIGADIGRRAVDANGTAIVCDNYMWRQDLGQEPSHPWVDDQIKWTNCLEQFTDDECREMLNG